MNSWDADANECRIYVPSPTQINSEGATAFVAVVDNGLGMSSDELGSLWHVGISDKRSPARRRPAKRLQIGKFGIGKLATYVIAERVTYITRGPDGLLGATLDFGAFKMETHGDHTTDPVAVDLRRLDESAFLHAAQIGAVIERTGLTASSLAGGGWPTWTIVVLEKLRPKASDIPEGRLRWVLSTAMPLATDFQLALNGAIVASSKEHAQWIVDFSLGELEARRIQALRDQTGLTWHVEPNLGLVSETFPSGIRGRARVADRSLYVSSAKSEDLGRSNGFFVRVRRRLVAESDPLFGLKPLSYQTFNNFVAEIDADDLDNLLKASRSEVEQAEPKAQLRMVLNEVFNQARDLYQDILKQREEDEKRRREGQRTYVDTRLVELPVAEAMLIPRDERPSWFYVDAELVEDQLTSLVTDLYADNASRRSYRYEYVSLGRDQFLVAFNPATRVFALNDDHELVVEYKDDVHSRRLLENFATAEAMLEVYLRELRVGPFLIDEVLTRRDRLLRSLAMDEVVSLAAIARQLREAKDDPYDLEIALVAAARALGFVAKHVGGSKEPDGEARYKAYTTPDADFTLEAKSSKAVPQLPQLDFAGLRSHWDRGEASTTRGCMLVAPEYPAEQSQDSEVANRARQQSVSCWTVDDLARVVEVAESRRITAEDVATIVFERFSPTDVKDAVDGLLTRTAWAQDELYRRILAALRTLEPQLPKSPRRISTVAGVLAATREVPTATEEDIRLAVEELAKASRGMLHVAPDSDVILVRGSLDELERRVASFLGQSVTPRRRGTFRDRGEQRQ